MYQLLAVLLDIVNPVLPVEKRRVLQGSIPQRIECAAVGFPPPEVTLLFEDKLVKVIQSGTRRSKAAVKMTVSPSAGRYTCIAVGYYLRPTGGFILRSRVKFIDVEVYRK